jgi:uncharacterized delta-60 repeat protein
MLRASVAALTCAAVWGFAVPLAAAPGDLDPTFGSGGTVALTVPGGSSSAVGVVALPDGRLVVVAQTAEGDFTLARVNADGTLDTSFGTGGFVTTDFAGGFDMAEAIIRQPDGRLVVAGVTNTSAGDYFALARYDVDGTLDPTFGTGGLVTTDFPGGSSEGANSLALQPDGKIVAAGWVPEAGGGAFGIARYEMDGALDGSFGAGGLVATVVAPYYYVVYPEAVLVEPDGRIVAAGTGERGGASDIALVRYTADGSLDPTFGAGGIVTTDLAIFDSANALALRPDGRLLAAGGAASAPFADFALVSYASDGSLDTSFGSGGIVETGPSIPFGFASALVLDPDGKFVAAGEGGASSFVLVRYTSDGSLDGTFGQGGIAYGPAGGASALVRQSDGKLVAAGFKRNGSDDQVVLARYLNGTCGNGVVEPDELCDDGNLVSGDGCDANCTPTSCGNGIVTSGEECDDGAANGIPGDCCTATCQFQATGTACPDDGNACTQDVCDAGTCTHPFQPAGTGCPADDDLCTADVCNATGTCTHSIAPSPVCVTPTVSGGALLRLQASVSYGRRAQFNWGNGPVVPLTDFGDPGSELSRVCVYDQTGPGSYALVLSGSPSAIGRGTWKATSTGWRFKSRFGVPDGITRVSLEASTAPLRARVQVKAKNPTFATELPLQAHPSVVAQFKMSHGTCWGATFSMPKTNSATEFKANSD